MTINPTVAFDIEAVSAAWVQENYEAFGISKLPRAEVFDPADGYSGKTSYNLAPLSESLLAGEGSMLDWTYGQSPPLARKLGESEVSFTVAGKTTRARPMPLKQGDDPNTDSRFRQLHQQTVPTQLSKCYQWLDMRLAATCLDTTKFTQINFTIGTSGSGLDTASDYGEQQPLRDIQDQLDLLRPFRSFAGVKLVCFLSGRVATTFAGHPALNGGGQNSGVAAQLPRSVFAERFKGILEIDDVYILDVATNISSLGQTASIQSIAQQADTSAVCWFGLLDTRGPWDLKSSSGQGPDGALAYASARMPTIVTNHDMGAEAIYAWGRTSGIVYSPRGAAGGPATDLGFFMRPKTDTAQGGIFA